MTVNTADNRYGVAQFIVAPTIAEGANYTTIAAAITAASSGQTIFIRPGTYTENLTLKAGVNLCAFGPSIPVFSNATIPNVIINGTCTFTAAGTVGISGICLQTNAAFALAVTGSAASIVKLDKCFLRCVNNTGVSFTSSSASSEIDFSYCNGDLDTTGIALFAHSAVGNLRFLHSFFRNTGVSTTNNTVSDVGSFSPDYSSWANGLTLSSSSTMNGSHLDMTMSGNQTALTTSSTATATIIHGVMVSGTASAISIGVGTTVTLHYCLVSSANANAIAGSGTLSYTDIVFNSVAAIQGTVTQTGSSQMHRPSITTSSLQPAFLATHSVAQDNVTGNSTEVTVNFTTEVFDQNANYDGTNLFTAPFTGRYQFNSSLTINDAATSTSAYTFVNTSNRAYVGASTVPSPLGAVNTYQLSTSCLADMDAADTANIRTSAGGMAGNTADLPAAVSNTWFSGFLVC